MKYIIKMYLSIKKNLKNVVTFTKINGMENNSGIIMENMKIVNNQFTKNKTQPYFIFDCIN